MKARPSLRGDPVHALAAVGAAIPVHDPDLGRGQDQGRDLPHALENATTAAQDHALLFPRNVAAVNPDPRGTVLPEAGLVHQGTTVAKSLPVGANPQGQGKIAPRAESPEVGQGHILLRRKMAANPGLEVGAMIVQSLRIRIRKVDLKCI